MTLTELRSLMLIDLSVITELPGYSDYQSAPRGKISLPFYQMKLQMKKFNLIIVLFTALVISSTAAYSQDTTRTFTLSGSLDTYARTAFGYKSIAPETAFAKGKGFGIGMANLIASYEGEKVGFVADLVFGPRGREAVFNSEQGIVNQLFAYVKVSDALTVNMGQFNTFVGYEVISPAVNFHYSTSYMFSYGPFSHTGVRADFSFGDGMVAKLAVLNPTDFLEMNPYNTYTIGGQIGKTSDAGGVWLNLLYGDQDGKLDEDDDFDGDTGSQGSLFQVDLTAGYTLSETFYLGINTSYQTVAPGQFYDADADELEDLDGDAGSFFGIALYPKLTLSETFSLGARVEHLMVKNGHLGGVVSLDEEGEGSVTTFTLSGNFILDNLTIIPEIRVDKMSEDSFDDKDGEGTDILPSLTLAAVYRF